MEGLGIFSGADLAAKDPVWLATHFGNSAEWLFNLARGIDHRRVKSNRPLKSLGGERTFFNDLITDTEIDRTRVVQGKSVSVRVDLGGSRIIKKKKKKT